MANKRMFSVDVVETDAFLKLPPKVRELYFHLGMHGDDDGFVSNPKSILRTIGCKPRDLKQLETAGYVISFDSGALVITDWKVNNNLRNQRYKPTPFQNEFMQLRETASRRYILVSDGQPDVNQSSTVGMTSGNQLEPQQNVTQHNIAEQQRPTAPHAACAPLKGARGGMTALGSSLDHGDRDAATDEARRKFFESIKRPEWPAAEAAPPDAEKKE